MNIVTRAKIFTAILAIVVMGLGYAFLNPGNGSDPARDRKDEGDPVTLTVHFLPNPMPKGYPVVIGAYVTSCPAKECTVRRGTSPWSLTLHARKGETVHLSALQQDQSTTMIECWLHHKNKAVAHDLAPRGMVTCEWVMV